MIAELRAYPAMKDSGVPWLREVPAHWEVRRLKTFSKMRSGESITGLSIDERGDYPVFGGNGVRGYTSTYTHDGRYVLIGRQGALCGNVHLASGRFWASEHAVAASLRLGFDVDWFRALLTAMNLNQYSIAAAQPGLAVERVLNLQAPVPSVDEQRVISRFLSHADRRIRRYIRAKQKLIKLLEEQKQAIIHRAVTRGLDPKVRLKPSGVEWLGEVPEHWEVKKLKHLSRQIVDGTHFTPKYIDQGVPFVRVTDIQSEALNMTRLRRISEEEHAQINLRCNPERGDLLLSKNGTIGLTKVVDWDFPVSIFVSLCLIKPIAAMVDAYFVSFAFKGGLLIRQLSEITKTTSVTNLHLEKIRDLIIPLPPLGEQRRILDSTRDELRPFDHLFNTARHEISLLREYRTRLIADVVTGKLDVRAAAASLPDEADEPEAPDDSEALAVNDEDTTDGDPDAAPEETEA